MARPPSRIGTSKTRLLNPVGILGVGAPDPIGKGANPIGVSRTRASNPIKISRAKARNPFGIITARASDPIGISKARAAKSIGISWESASTDPPLEASVKRSEPGEICLIGENGYAITETWFI